MKYIARVCPDIHAERCQDRVGEACGFRGWKNNERPGPFCKNYRRCANPSKREVKA